jgi:secretion/DNA translocation related TadE-like protein
MAGIALLALMLVAVAGALALATSAASEAATAADLAALAAADAARGLTPGEPCAAAEAVAAQHRAVLRECTIQDPGSGTVLIRVTVQGPGLLPDAEGAARAGAPP